MKRGILGLLLVSACFGKSPVPLEKEYTLYWTADHRPPGGVPVKLSVPGAWDEKVGALGGPSFTVPGIQSMLSTVALAAIPCPAEGDCIERALALQYGPEERPALSREQLAPDRVFVVDDRRLAESGGRRRVHARLVTVHPASRSAVMCVIFLMDKAGDRLPELRKVCESLTL